VCAIRQVQQQIEKKANEIESPVELLEGEKKRVFVAQKAMLEKQRAEFRRKMEERESSEYSNNSI